MDDFSPLGPQGLLGHLKALELLGQLTSRAGSLKRCVTVQYSTVQYSTVQYSTVQYSTVQYSTVQYSTVQYSTVQNQIALRHFIRIVFSMQYFLFYEVYE